LRFQEDGTVDQEALWEKLDALSKAIPTPSIQRRLFDDWENVS
jgi:hypothetical protein